MDRRAFLGTIAGGLLAAPLVGGAQQTKVYRVGLLLQSSPPISERGPGIFQKTLHDLGYIEGRCIRVDGSWTQEVC